MNVEKLRSLINDLESDCVERTISTSNTDKFGQAICAFANDLPNHHIPGYLILGVEDDGTIKGVHVTDDLLKNMAAIRTDGNMQPQPSMTVEAIANGFIVEENMKEKGHGSVNDSQNGHKNGHGSVNDSKNGHKNGHGSMNDSKNGHKNGHGSVNDSKNGHKNGHGLTNNHFTSDIVRNIYEVIKLNPKAKYSDIQDNLGISIATIRRAITELKNLGYINPKPSKVKGVWQLIEQPD